MNLHLDDEALSALLDGEPDAAADDHARSCGRCGARLGALEGAARAVGGAPPPPTDRRRDEIIEAALDATSIPVAGAPPTDRGSGSPPSPRLVNVARPWVGVAAAVAVLAVAVAVVGSRLGPDVDQPRAAFDGPPQTTLESSGESAGGVGPEPDLGEIDLRSLRDDPPKLDELAAGLAERGSDLYAGGDAGDAPRSMASRPAGEPPAAAMEAPPSTPTCEHRLRQRHPELAALAYAASATVDGAPVEVLGFEVAGPSQGGGAPGRLIVARRGSCTELAAVDVGR